MKSMLLTTLGAALLLVPALAGAAPANQSNDPATPAFMVANSNQAPSTSGTLGAVPTVSYQGATIPVTSTMPRGRNSTPIVVPDSTWALVNGTGGGR